MPDRTNPADAAVLASHGLQLVNVVAVLRAPPNDQWFQVTVTSNLLPRFFARYPTPDLWAAVCKPMWQSTYAFRVINSEVDPQDPVFT